MILSDIENKNEMICLTDIVRYDKFPQIIRASSRLNDLLTEKIYTIFFLRIYVIFYTRYSVAPRPSFQKKPRPFFLTLDRNDRTCGKFFISIFMLVERNIKTSGILYIHTASTVAL